jgi:outer membrane lipoprotein-sorting protein
MVLLCGLEVVEAKTATIRSLLISNESNASNTEVSVELSSNVAFSNTAFSWNQSTFSRNATLLNQSLVEESLTRDMVGSPALQKLKEKFAEQGIFRAEMSHHFTDSYTDEVTSTFGTIWIGTNVYRIDTPDQIIVVDGEISTVYNKAQKKVIISNYSAEDDEFAPSRFFGATTSAYSSEDIIDNDGSTTIFITTDDPFEMFQEVRIRVARDGNPLEISAIDQMENDVRTTFRFGRFEQPQQHILKIDYPADAEIVDLRDE